MLEGQRVLVLGGTSGIGLATARTALDAGAAVTIGGRDPRRLEAALTALDGRAQGIRVDATDRASLEAMLAAVGKLDHLVLSVATGGGAGPLATLDLTALQQAIEGKLLAFLRALQVALPYLRKDGSVTFVTAASARAAAPGTAGLAANNGALNVAVAPLAVELAPLRVNAVCPGIVETPIFERWPEELRERFFERARATPVGRIGRPEDIAKAILFLMTDDFVTGTLLDCDGGIRLGG